MKIWVGNEEKKKKTVQLSYHVDDVTTQNITLVFFSFLFLFPFWHLINCFRKKRSICRHSLWICTYMQFSLLSSDLLICFKQANERTKERKFIFYSIMFQYNRSFMIRMHIKKRGHFLSFLFFLLLLSLHTPRILLNNNNWKKFFLILLKRYILYIYIWALFNCKRTWNGKNESYKCRKLEYDLIC